MPCGGASLSLRESAAHMKIVENLAVGADSFDVGFLPLHGDPQKMVSGRELNTVRMLDIERIKTRAATATYKGDGAATGRVAFVGVIMAVEGDLDSVPPREFANRAVELCGIRNLIQIVIVAGVDAGSAPGVMEKNEFPGL